MPEKKYIAHKTSSTEDTFKYIDKSKVKITRQFYSEIINEFLKFIVQWILEGNEFKIPYRLGVIKIVGIQQKITFDKDGNIQGAAPNWRLTKELWDSNPQAKAEKKLVYNFNEHSNGIRYKIKWGKKYIGLQYKIFYSFIPARTFKRSVWKNIMNGKEYEIVKSIAQ